MGKRVSNVANMSLIRGVTCQQIMSCVGDTLATFCLSIHFIDDKSIFKLRNKH